MTSREEHLKQVSALRYWLIGRRYFMALAAMEFAAKFHVGTRKDGVTPEFSHQVQIAFLIRTLESSLVHPEETIAVVFLHDVPEDFDVGFLEIGDRFGTLVRADVEAMTKKHRGKVVPSKDYYQRLSEHVMASVAKGGDRTHNLKTMPGVFVFDKQVAYISETVDLTIPMLKQARRNFPRQEAAYENLKLMLRTQVDLIQAIHKAEKAGGKAV